MSSWVQKTKIGVELGFADVHPGYLYRIKATQGQLAFVAASAILLDNALTVAERLHVSESASGTAASTHIASLDDVDNIPVEGATRLPAPSANVVSEIPLLEDDDRGRVLDEAATRLRVERRGEGGARDGGRGAVRVGGRGCAGNRNQEL